MGYIDQFLFHPQISLRRYDTDFLEMQSNSNRIIEIINMDDCIRINTVIWSVFKYHISLQIKSNIHSISNIRTKKFQNHEISRIISSFITLWIKKLNQYLLSSSYSWFLFCRYLCSKYGFTPSRAYSFCLFHYKRIVYPVSASLSSGLSQAIAEKIFRFLIQIQAIYFVCV